MTYDEIHGQNEVFEAAKKSLVNELSSEMLSWDFSRMMEEFKRAIREKAPKNKNDSWSATRSFARNYLGMSGDERFKKVLSWFKGEAMSAEEIQLVLTTLKLLREDGSPSSASKKPKENVRQETFTESVEKKASPGAIRGFVDHAITMANSSMILASELGVTPADLFDGDRIKMRIAIRGLCESCGIEVIFPEPKATQSQQVTREDLKAFGFGSAMKRGSK